MKRSRSIEIFSLSFLDLIFCSMAGVLVLYVIADSSEPTDGNKKSVRQVIVTLPKAEETALPTDDLALMLRLSTTNWSAEGSTGGLNGDWVVQRSPPEARLVLEDDVEYPLRLTVTVEDFRASRSTPAAFQVQVLLVDPAKPGPVAPLQLDLDRSNNYSTFHEWN